jgi:hypothetical protein
MTSTVVRGGGDRTTCDVTWEYLNEGEDLSLTCGCLGVLEDMCLGPWNNLIASL